MNPHACKYSKRCRCARARKYNVPLSSAVFRALMKPAYSLMRRLSLFAMHDEKRTYIPFFKSNITQKGNVFAHFCPFICRLMSYNAFFKMTESKICQLHDIPRCAVNSICMHFAILSVFSASRKSYGRTLC